MKQINKYKKLGLATLVGALFVSCGLALFWPNGQQEWLIISQIRLPRMLAALLVGSMVAISSWLVQIVFQEKMIDAANLGLMDGPYFLVLLSIVIVPDLANDRVIIGAVAGGLMMFVISHLQNIHQLYGRSLILSGLATAIFFLAMTHIIASGDGMRGVTLGSVTWLDIIFLLGILTLSGLVLSSYYPKLRFLALPEVQLQQLPLAVDRIRWQSLLIAGVLAGSAVSVLGSVLFVGVMMQFMLGMLWHRPMYRRLGLSVLLGMTIFNVGDILSAHMLGSRQLPSADVIQLTAVGVLLVMRGIIYAKRRI